MLPKFGWMMVGVMLLAVACRPADRDEASAVTDGPAPATTPQPARVMGKVLLQGQADASGIQVYIPGTSLISITDREGRFALAGVNTGEYEVAARAEGYGAKVLGKVTVPPSDKTQQITLDSVTLKHPDETAGSGTESRKFGSIRGRLASPGDGAVDWSFCTLELEKTPYRTAAALDGSFLFWNLPPDAYRLTARMPGFAPASAGVRVLPGPGVTSVTLTMQPSATEDEGVYISSATPIGTVGQPAPAGVSTVTSTTTATTARIHGIARKNEDGMTDMSGISVTLAGTSLVATTDGEGKYLIENVKPGPCQVLAQSEGYEPAQARIELKAGEDRALEDLVLEPRRDYPVVLETDPPDGARGVMVQREMPITVRFSKKMDPDSLRKAVHFEPEVAYRIFSGRSQSDTDFDLMKIVLYGVNQQPVARFRTRYTLVIGEAATDFEGLTLQEPYRTSFTTGAPEIVRTSPADGAKDMAMAPQTSVVITFNAPMNYETLTRDAVTIRPRPQLQPVFQLIDDGDSGWSNVLISGTWQPDTEYRVTVNRRVRTINNDSIANTPYTFRFKTARLIPMRPPTNPPRGMR